MRHPLITPRRLVPGTLAALAIGLTAVALAGPHFASAQMTAHLYIPLVQKGHEGGFPPVSTQAPGVTPSAPAVTASPTPTITATWDPSEPTNTQRPPTRTERPTNTPMPTFTPGPSPTPTLEGDDVSHSDGPDTIILQIGWTDSFSGTFSDVWEQMNGTPWVTVYGDGRVIASKGLTNRTQDLLVGHADEYDVQLWLRQLAYEAQYWTLDESYVHPQNPKGHLRVYANVTDGGFKLLDLAGFLSFERRPPDGDPRFPSNRISSVIRVARAIEAWIDRTLAEPYVAEELTLLVQEEKSVKPGFTLPKWTHRLDIKKIADAVPTKRNEPQRQPAHEPIDKQTGIEVRALIVPEADKSWLAENRAAMFSFSGNNYVVGARQEVPGGSLFLPGEWHDKWYPRGPGTPKAVASLPDALAPVPPLALDSGIRQWPVQADIPPACIAGRRDRSD